MKEFAGGARLPDAARSVWFDGAANLRRRRFLRLMLDALAQKLGSHLQAAEYTRG